MPSWMLKHTEEESPFTFDEIASLSNDGNYQVFLVSRCVAHTTTQSLFCHWTHHSRMVRGKTLSYLVLSAYRWICGCFFFLHFFPFYLSLHLRFALHVITQVRSLSGGLTVVRCCGHMPELLATPEMPITKQLAGWWSWATNCFV